MENELARAKKRVTRLFIVCLCIALALIGGGLGIGFTIKGTDAANDIGIEIIKCLVLAGVFFLVLAFGHILPNLIKVNKGKLDAPGTFSETNMRKTLGKYIPDGEDLLAGIRAQANESKITGIYGKCLPMEDRLLPHEEGIVVSLSKEKHSICDVFIGITQYSLLIAECDKNKHLYSIDEAKGVNEADIQNVTSEILLNDIGTRFSFTDIQSCKVKNGPMGAINCTITMKNGSYFKLLLPKASGMLGGMPQHLEYRKAIIAQLEKYGE